MTAVDFTLTLFCRIDDAIPDSRKHPLSKLYVSEIVTLGVLRALRGGSARHFDRWLRRELGDLFGPLPERTRLGRLLDQVRDMASHFLGDPTVFGVVDSYGIELIHPKRLGRSPKQIARLGFCGSRWIAGVKAGVVCNSRGEVVAWQVEAANTHDTRFVPLVARYHEQMVVLADTGFAASGKARNAKRVQREGTTAPNLKVCQRGQWNQRRLIETLFSLWSGPLQLKRLGVRSWNGLKTRLAFATAAYNLALNWSGQTRLSIAQLIL